MNLQSIPSPAPPATTAEGENAADSSMYPFFTYHKTPTRRLSINTKSISLSAQFSQPPPVTNNGTGSTTLTSAIKAERRRTVSLRKISEAREELLRRSHTPDIKEVCPSMHANTNKYRKQKLFVISRPQIIQPFEPLAFPLPIDTLEHMIQSMPSDYVDLIDECISSLTEADTSAATAAAMKALESSTAANANDLIVGDRFPSLLLEGDSDETESAASGAAEEDPNDPEWTEPAPRV